MIKKTSQQEKYRISMAGEFAVASQLYRKGLQASVTYANAKKVDVVAFSRSSVGKFTTIEVKSTSKKEWKIGNSLPNKSEKPWVFVLFPDNTNESPSFFVLTQKEVSEACTPRHRKYLDGYLQRHRKEFDERKSYIKIKFDQVRDHLDAWHKITSLVK